MFSVVLALFSLQTAAVQDFLLVGRLLWRIVIPGLLKPTVSDTPVCSRSPDDDDICARPLPRRQKTDRGDELLRTRRRLHASPVIR